jgi:ABC-type multidrug transport system fused ATPase/permease subunit
MLTRLLRGALRPYLAHVVLVVILLAIGAAGSLYLPNLNADIINDGVIAGHLHYILMTGLLMIGITLVLGVLSIWSIFVASKIAMGVGADLREAVFAKVQTFSAGEMNHFGTPTLITRNTNDLLVLSIARGAQPVGNIEIGGILAGGRTASALLAAEMHSLYPGATRSYALPNAMVGYLGGAGGVYDYYLQGGTALSVHERVIMLVAIHRGLAILVQVVGNYQAFSANGLNDGRPSIADCAAATIADPVVNSVVWAP